MSLHSPASRPQRDVWPDVAKGVCIALVVLWHAVTKHFQTIDWPTDLAVSGAWGLLGELLLPLRMPLFFTISGIFAVTAVARPWGELVRTRVAKFAYLYVVWVLIQTVVMWVTPAFDTARARSLGALVEYLTISPTNLWYLYALALYFVVAKLSTGPAHWPVLLGALALNIAAGSQILPTANNREQVFANLLFFLIGVHGSTRLRRYATQARATRLLVLTSLYAVGIALMYALDARTWPGVWPALGALAVGAGVTAAVLIARHAPRCAEPIAALGRNTLPIYVLHLPLLALFNQAQRRWTFEPTMTWYIVAEPAIVTAALIATSIWLGRLLARVGGGFLFQLRFTNR